MPKKKSTKQALKDITSVGAAKKQTVSAPFDKPPWMMTVYDPSSVSSSPDNLTPPIRRKTISSDEAMEISSEFGSRAFIVSADLACGVGRTIYPIADMLIAYGVVPQNAIILTFQNKEAQGACLSVMTSNGSVLLCDEIKDHLPNSVLENKPELYTMRSVEDLLWQVEYTGNIPDSVRKWVDTRFFAAFILNCCYLGRGCPAGLNYRYHVEKIANNTALIARFIAVITSGTKRLPAHIEPVSVPAWRAEMLWKMRSEHQFQKAFKREEAFRERFSVAPFIHQDAEVKSFARLHNDVKHIMKELIYAYEHGEDNTIQDIKYDEPDAPQQLAQLLETLGMTEVIRASSLGIPVNDLILTPHDQQKTSKP